MTLDEPAAAKLNLLAGVQYRIQGHTITFARRPSVCDPVTCDLIAEIDGTKPRPHDAIPRAIAKEIMRLARA